MASPAITAYDPNGAPFQTSQHQFHRLFEPRGCTLTPPTKTKQSPTKSGTAGASKEQQHGSE